MPPTTERFVAPEPEMAERSGEEAVGTVLILTERMIDQCRAIARIAWGVL